MYTRSRQNANFAGGNPRTPNAGINQQQSQQPYPGQGAYNQPGNYQGGNQNQQNAYKQGNIAPYKQPPQQQPQTPQQQQARPPNPQTPQMQQRTPTQQPQPQRLKPILKTSSSAQNNQNNQTQVQGQEQNQNQGQSQVQQNPQPYNQNQQNLVPQQQTNNGAVEIKESIAESMEGDFQDTPKWKRKTPGFKVNRKLKRLRMNQRLRKTLQPKNAIMVLNEMKTGVQFTFPEAQTSSLPNSLFLVHAEINGKTYVGQGLSKPLARQNAAENALKSLLLEKMTAAAMKARLDAENEGAAAAAAATAASASTAENPESKEAEPSLMESSVEETDEIPWSSLASFALYKLFLEWQNQGTVVPVSRPGLSPGKVKKESPKVIVQKDLPPNAISIHPVMLLNQMRPGLPYAEINRSGNPPNTMFTLAVEVDGQEYSGTAKNKKHAKKIAAKAALRALYNLDYPEEKEGEDMA